nr:helix-turn-helix domain-containing protein [Serinicoccus sp. CNJ-927]
MPSSHRRVLPFRPSERLEGTDSPSSGAADPVSVGRRVRHHRREAGLTLADVAARVELSTSALSLIENGRREARASVLGRLATALDVDLTTLLTGGPPSRRAALEVRWERAQRAEGFQTLGIPPVRVGPGLPDDALEALVGLYESVVGLQQQRAATPEFARLANAELRARMREAGNYFADIESAAAALVEQVGHTQGPLSREAVNRIARHVGFEIVAVPDVPASTRTVTDLAHRRIYLPEGGGHDPRAAALQALGHVVLDHQPPRDYAEFLAQRVEINYFAAATLVPESSAVPLLRRAKAERDIALEDLRDTYAVSYETAAHRFCNLATEHLDLQVHFMRTSADGVIYKPTRTTACASRWTPRERSRARGSAGRGPPGSSSTSPVARSTTSTPTPVAGPTGAPRSPNRPRPGSSRSASGCPSTRCAGCAGGTPRSDGSPGAPTPGAAPDPRPRWPVPGTGRSGPAPGRTRTSSPSCRRASSRGSTRPRCCASWRGTPPRARTGRRPTPRRSRGSVPMWHNEGVPICGRPSHRARMCPSPPRRRACSSPRGRRVAHHRQD